MHYIRLLRPAKFDATNPEKPFISVLIAITTDLGDAFLQPVEPVKLLVPVDGPVDPSISMETETRPPAWRGNKRILEIKAPLKPHTKKEAVTCTLKIHPQMQPQPLGTLNSGYFFLDPPDTYGLIMPVTVKMTKGVCSSVCVRTLELDTGPKPEHEFVVDFEEDIGESIARHIWDAGLVTASYLAEACQTRMKIREVLPISSESFSVLELGSGVGILGITLACILERAAEVQGQALHGATVLLTDLPEAEERARSNIARAKSTLLDRSEGDPVVDLQYENLDWDDGKRGRFGPLASARAWDLVVLSDCTYNADSQPALVGTLSAVHAAGTRHHGPAHTTETQVLLATKPRHDSEDALFHVLTAAGWAYRLLARVPLPRIGDDAPEEVQLWALRKDNNVE
ncbi:putative methyltransferase-domain-containing protein [Hypoxylon fuscum]|nr:putative methyltransferase-domain-containing protein [Hypoxylon fuscum]